MTAPSVGGIQGISHEELVLMANDWFSIPIDVRFRFTWPLICKLAVKAVCLNKSFEELCEHALRLQLQEMRNG